MQIQTNIASANIPVKGSGYTTRISLIAALAGFIFGFDTVVISGANQPIKDWSLPWKAIDFLICNVGIMAQA